MASIWFDEDNVVYKTKKVGAISASGRSFNDQTDSWPLPRGQHERAFGVSFIRASIAAQQRVSPVRKVILQSGASALSVPTKDRGAETVSVRSCEEGPPGSLSPESERRELETAFSTDLWSKQTSSLRGTFGWEPSREPKPAVADSGAIQLVGQQRRRLSDVEPPTDEGDASSEDCFDYRPFGCRDATYDNAPG